MWSLKIPYSLFKWVQELWKLLNHFLWLSYWYLKKKKIATILILLFFQKTNLESCQELSRKTLMFCWKTLIKDTPSHCAFGAAACFLLHSVKLTKSCGICTGRKNFHEEHTISELLLIYLKEISLFLTVMFLVKLWNPATNFCKYDKSSSYLTCIICSDPI